MSEAHFNQHNMWDAPERLKDPLLHRIGWLLHEGPHRLLTWVRDRRRATTATLVLLTLFATLAVLAAVAEWILLEVDQPVQQAAIDARSGWLNDAMVALTFLGTRWVIGGLTLLISLWALATGRCRFAVGILVVAVLLNPVIEIGFKELIGRARPDAARLLPGRGPSFPSGHVLASVGFYGVLPFLVWEATTRYWARRLVFFLSAAIILVVAVSRVYIDVHWSSDVVAGLMLGGVIIAVTYHAMLGHGFHSTRSCCATAPA